MTKQKAALALGGGGARGIAHIGVIRELLKNGYDITSISGTSMGALVGGIYACGKLDEYEAWLTSLSKMDVFSLVDFTLRKKGIIKADRVFHEIHKFIPDQQIEDLPIQFAAVATDIKLREEVVITEGSLFEAIRASISVPLLIAPFHRNDTLFVDGGVLNPVPVNRVFRTDGDILIAVNVNASDSGQKPISNNPDWAYFEKKTTGKLRKLQKKISGLFPEGKKEKMGYFDLMSETTSIMISQITKLTLELNPPDILIEVSRNACSQLDFYKAQEIIGLGKEAAMEALSLSADKLSPFYYLSSEINDGH